MRIRRLCSNGRRVALLEVCVVLAVRFICVVTPGTRLSMWKGVPLASLSTTYASCFVRSLPLQRRDMMARVRASADSGGAKQEMVFNVFTQDWQLVIRDVPQGPRLDEMLSEFLPWSAAEKEALALFDEKLPDWRTSMYGPDDDAGFRRRFRIIAAVAGGEAAALDAFAKNTAVVYFGDIQIRKAGEILQQNLGRERAFEIIKKNPGVLTIDADSLRDNLGAVEAMANVIGILVQYGAASRAVATTFGGLFVVAIGKALFDVVMLRTGLGTP